MQSISPLSRTLQEVLEHHIQFTENAIAVFDPDNKFVLHNHAFARFFGLDPQRMDGWGLDDWLTWMYVHRGGVNIEWDTLESWLDYVHSVSRSKPFRRFETDLIDGRWLLVSEQVYESGYLVLHCADISLQKKTERDLKEAVEKIERLAQTDELTGMPNRRHILNRLNDEFLRARRYRHPFCLSIIDIDHFKLVNDKYGHPVGDEVLRHLSAFLQSHLRSQDMVGRLGGEEFVILFPETEAAAAMLVLSRIREALQEECLEYVASGFSYTFSAGLAAISPDLTEDCIALMARADKALYRAKHAGRNQVACADQQELAPLCPTPAPFLQTGL